MAKNKKHTSNEENKKSIEIMDGPETPAAEPVADGPEETAGQEPPVEETPGEEIPGEDIPEETAPEEGTPAEEEQAQGFFEKKDPRDAKIEDLTDRLQRQMAEFENFRKRTDREKATMYDMGARDIIEKLLPVIDNFERGLDGAAEGDPFVDGIQMIYKQLMTMLTDAGVEPIEAVGQNFDPELHNAVMHVDDESYGENIVAEELQKGYRYKGNVIRFSMVKVAN